MKDFWLADRQAVRIFWTRKPAEEEWGGPGPTPGFPNSEGGAFQRVLHFGQMVRAGLWGRVILCFFCGWMAVSFPASNASESSPKEISDTQLKAYLGAGEFAPALEAVRAIADPARRSVWLERIALAQAEAGARQAAFTTLRYIPEDPLRSQSLHKVLQQPLGARGGGVEPDFDSLIDLIISTVRPSTWEDAGGSGSISPFPTGVYIDAQGVLHRSAGQETSGQLSALHRASRRPLLHDATQRPSLLRKISLVRLEREVQFRLASGLPLPETVQVLAGLQRVQYIFVYPEERDLVLAGPAGPWHVDSEGRFISDQTGLPVVRLDDLVVVFRHILQKADARFGCAITPTQEGLKQVREFLDEWKDRPIRPVQQERWLSELRSRLGRQKIELFGLDPQTRPAQILVEADYHMKLIGMGLAEGVPGVVSFLDLIEVPKGMAPPRMEVLRWWFTLHYDAVLSSPDHQAFALEGQGIRVLSENELLTSEGQRVPTGQAETTNRLFAKIFTEHLEELARKYPIYGELRHLADLAMTAAIIRNERLAEKVGWSMAYWLDPQGYPIAQVLAPTEVESVMNSRTIDQRYILAGVSGGVRIAPGELIRPGAIPHDYSGQSEKQHRAGAPPNNLPLEAWWWD